MTEQRIKPEKITKPIQLLGAWLAGLFSIDSCFLFAAANMETGSWESKALVIAAMANVPVFLLAVFLLQTKFRPELQEDSYYSSYLSQKTNEPVKVSKNDAHFIALSQRLDSLEREIGDTSQSVEPKGTRISNLLIGINKYLSDREAIKLKLAEVGVLSCSVFGITNAPIKRNVSISQYLPKDTLTEVVALAGELGFEHYNTFDNRAEDTNEDILFGSYGSAEFEILHRSA